MVSQIAPMVELFELFCWPKKASGKRVPPAGTSPEVSGLKMPEDSLQKENKSLK